MEIVNDIKHAICALFEVHSDANGVQRIVTPLEYPGSGDRIVIRVRPHGRGFSLDENGEAALYASMAGGDTEADNVMRWAGELEHQSPARYDAEDESIRIYTEDQRLLAPYIFRVAEAAQQLFAISTSRTERQTSDFKERVKSVVAETANKLSLPVKLDYDLPIAGGLMADYYIESSVPLIIIAATSTTRLLEAEVIHMQYRVNKMNGFVLAVAESQASVGKRQFERANYYTGKTVSFIPYDLEQLITVQTQH